MQVLLEPLLGCIFVVLSDDVKTPPPQQVTDQPAGVLGAIVEDMPS